MTKISFRHELKYLITEAEAQNLERRLEVLMKKDPHAKDGTYFIRSLYFDNCFNSAYEEKMGGSDSRKKYRIRFYDCKDDVIKLECKHKEGKYIHKVSASLSREETNGILAGDYHWLLEKEQPLYKEFYFFLQEKGKPKVIVDYDRTPYIYPFGDVRITFDRHVRSSFMNLTSQEELFCQRIPAAEVLEPGFLILEVKFTEYLPSAIKGLLEIPDSIYTAASKYVMCLDKEFEYNVI